MTQTQTPAPPAANRPFLWGRILGRIALYLAVGAVSLLTFFPVYWMLASAFQPNYVIMRFPPPLLPVKLDFTEFNALVSGYPIVLWIRNSFFIALMSMLICTALTVLGAYALSTLRWRGRLAFGLFLLITQMLPEIQMLIPLYIVYRRLGWLNHLPPLSVIDAAFALPVCIWILKGVFDTIPAEILDAGVVDGCTELSVMWWIVLPLSLPGLVAVAVVSFFSGWNEYLYASLFLGNAELMPASVGLSVLKAISYTPVEQYMAAGLIFSILPVVFYLAMQRYIIAGLTAGAVKG